MASVAVAYLAPKRDPHVCGVTVLIAYSWGTLPDMAKWSRLHVGIAGMTVLLAVPGAILVWSSSRSLHDLGQALIGAAILVGVVLPAVLRARRS